MDTKKPKNGRPSWLSLNVDGRASSVETGPRGRTGNMHATFFARNKGEVERKCVVLFTPDENGNRTLFQIMVDSEVIHKEWIEQ